ncbi:MAG: FapA family protein [Sporomusaceae bacterium]|nr:FapA family protein [Sporomusaceae bacterium]
MDKDDWREATEPQSEPSEQRFAITSDSSGVFLTVYPEAGSVAVTEPEVVASLQAMNIFDYQLPAIVNALKAAAGVPLKIGESARQDPDIQVLVERDRMEAFVIITGGPGIRLATPQEVTAKLEAAGVRYGIKEENIARACQRPGPKTAVASGLAAVNGQDARIVYHFSLEKNVKPVENENGSVDYKNINLFTTVREGDLLAEKLPPIPGKAGTDVLGNVLQPKPGRDLPLPIGKNVAEKDGKVVAAIAGQVTLINKKIHVMPLIVINGDVDFSSGNIEFSGNVTIKGSVQPGFSVKAGGDIEVQGTVSGAVVEGRNVTIRMGIQGMFRGHLKASEHVYAKFIENSNVSADGDIHVSDAILHSRVSARRKVIVEGKRGMIVGGKISAGEEIRAKAAGNHLAIVTELEVGVTPVLREEYHLLCKDIHKVEASLDQTQKSLQILRAANPDSLTPERREMLLKMTKAQFQLAGQAESMRSRIAEIEVELDQVRHGRIRIADAVYPGVKIVVGTHVKSIRETVRFVSFHADDGELQTGAYK